MQNDPNNFQNNINNVMNTPDHTSQFDPADIQANKGMAALSYIGFLFLIPMLAAPNSRYARFHVNQGLALFIVEVIASIAIGIVSTILGLISWFVALLFSFVSGLAGIVFLVFLIIGVINAINGKAKPLPLIGGITILK